MPNLVGFSKVDLDLFSILESMAGVKLGPGEAVAEYIILARKLLRRSLGSVDLLLSLSRCRHRYRVCRCLRKSIICRVRQEKPLPFNLDTITAHIS
jgi:hypothetical protein